MMVVMCDRLGLQGSKIRKRRSLVCWQMKLRGAPW